jgi:hypothetical protein
MGKNILHLFLAISLSVNAQKKQDKLYYFLTKDSLLGVKNQAGEVIIKPVTSYWAREMNKPIKDHLIYLDRGHGDSIEPHSCGAVFNRKGDFLFEPFAFDNGPDGFSEGLMRFVKNKKTGFANRNGDVVIEAKYDFAGIFNYGIASYCNGCTWKSKGEHSFVTGGTWGYINYKGEEITVLDRRMNERDQLIDSNKYLPCQFSYSNLEKKIIDSFYKFPEISKAYYVNFYSPLDSNERQLRYEIVERPSSYYPYYHIVAYEYSKRDGFRAFRGIMGLDFFTDRKGCDFFVFDYYDNKISFTTWLKKYVKDAKEYLKTNSGALYKF